MDDVFLHFFRDYIWVPCIGLAGWLVTRSIAHSTQLDAHKLFVSEHYVKKTEHIAAFNRLEDRINEGFDSLDEKLDRKFDTVFNKIDQKQDKTK